MKLAHGDSTLPLLEVLNLVTEIVEDMPPRNRILLTPAQAPFQIRDILFNTSDVLPLAPEPADLHPETARLLGM